MPARYRVAIIGHTGRGNYGHGIDTVWLRFPDRCEIVGVADPDPRGRDAAASRLKAPRAFADYRQMLEQTRPQIVAICPRWVDQHRDMAVAAAECGAHIYMEKPMCRTPAEADEIIAACKRNDVQLALAHQTRYSPRLQVVRELLEAGTLGTILEFRGRGKEDHRGGGEDLWVLGSHIMNLIHVLGGEPTWCFGRLEQAGRPVTRAEVQQGNEGLGPLAGDHAVAMFGLESGATAYFGSRRSMARGNGRFGLQVFGSQGVLEILTGYLPPVHLLRDPLWSPGQSKQAWVEVTSAGIGKPEPLKDGGLDAGNQLAVQDLLSAIENDRLPECNMYEGRMTVEMICAVFESHRLGRPVSIPLATRQNPLSLL